MFPMAVMGIGLPGSGKSHELTPIAKDLMADYICPDDIRKEMTGDANDQSRNAEVWEEAHRRAKHALLNGRSIVVDATHTDRDRRREQIKMYKDHGAKSVVGVHVDTPIDVAKARNQMRDRVVPDHVIEQMNQQLQHFPPALADGFDRIYKV